MSRNTKKSASEQFAGKCLEAVCDAIAFKDGYSYISDEESRRKWYRLLPYDSTNEQLAIKTVADIILTHTDNRPDHQNAEFIKCVLHHVVKSLAQYTIKNPDYHMDDINALPANTDIERAYKKQMRKNTYGLAENDLLIKLIKQNSYLQHLKEKEQQRKQEKILEKKIGHAAYKKEKMHALHVAQARTEYQITTGVQNEFKNVAQYKRGKRR